MGVPIGLKKMGNSKAFPLPSAFIRAHSLDQFTSYDLDWRDGQIVITPIEDERAASEEAVFESLFGDFGPEHVSTDLLKSDRRGREEF